MVALNAKENIRAMTVFGTVGVGIEFEYEDRRMTRQRCRNSRTRARAEDSTLLGLEISADGQPVVLLREVRLQGSGAIGDVRL